MGGQDADYLTAKNAENTKNKNQGIIAQSTTLREEPSGSDSNERRKESRSGISVSVLSVASVVKNIWLRGARRGAGLIF